MRVRLSALMCVCTLIAVDRVSGQAVNTVGFVPAVQWADTIARCGTWDANLLPEDERGFLLRFGTDENGRTVSAVWDTSGHLRRYTDARGDRRGPGIAAAQRGARTTILIDMVKGVALLINDVPATASKSSMITAAAALDAPSLGPPRQLLGRLHAQCGAPPTP